MRLRSFSRKQKLWASAAACVLLLGVIALFAATRPKKPQAPPPTEVEVVQVEQKDVPIYGEWIGTTEGMVNAEIRAQVSGYLLKQDYTEGSFVTKGQLLFEIDARPFQATLEQAKGKLAQAQGQLGQANSQFTQAEAQVGQAQAQVSQAQAQLDQAEANQLKTQLDVNKYRPLRERKAVTLRSALSFSFSLLLISTTTCEMQLLAARSWCRKPLKQGRHFVTALFGKKPGPILKLGCSSLECNSDPTQAKPCKSQQPQERRMTPYTLLLLIGRGVA
jgi:multidrug efflux pump subunit AcrA (membrane-fusion protein)